MSSNYSNYHHRQFDHNRTQLWDWQNQQTSWMEKLDSLWTALDKLESRMDANDRRLGKLRPPQRPDPEPPYRLPDRGGADWDKQHRRYTQPPYRQPQHHQPNRDPPPPPYQPDRRRPHHLHQTRYQRPEHYQPLDDGPPPTYRGFLRRQILQPQHVPSRQPSCWDPSGARVSMGSPDYEERAPIYYPDYDCESDGYDEDFDVGYSRQPYHQRHSVPHLRQAAACLEQPPAEQQPLLQRPPSCRHPSSGTIDEETCFMDDEIDYLSDNEKGAEHGGITATATETLPAPPHAAESQCFSHLHLHHDPYISSPLVVAAILPPQAAILPPCSPDMINTVVQHRGKTSPPKEEIKSILLYKGIIGRTASGNQPLITGFGCLRDPNMEQEKLNTTDASIGFSYVMAETRNHFAIKYVYIGHEIIGYWGAKHQSRAFDPGGVASPKHIFVKIVIVSWFPP